MKKNLFLKICHWLVTLFHLVFIYFGLTSVLAITDLTETHGFDKKLLIMAKNNLWLYFSLWGVVLQVTYFLLVSFLEVCDTVPLLSKMTNLRDQMENLRKNFFISLVFPITLCAGISFWVVYAYDREQIYPSAIDKVIAPWLNHAIHTIPPVLVVIHLFFVDLSGTSTRNCFFVLICFDIMYNLCFMWSGIVHGNWIYLICEAMAGEKLALAISVCNLSTAFYFVLGRVLTSYVSRVKRNNTNEPKKVN